MIALRPVLLVFLGGTIGSAARLGLSLLLTDALVATLTVNVLGSFFIGILVARVRGGAPVRDFLGVGVLGGFTTYSAFAVQVVQTAPQEPALGVAYAAGSLLLGVASAALGAWLGRRRPAS